MDSLHMKTRSAAENIFFIDPNEITINMIVINYSIGWDS